MEVPSSVRSNPGEWLSAHTHQFTLSKHLFINKVRLDTQLQHKILNLFQQIFHGFGSFSFGLQCKIENLLAQYLSIIWIYLGIFEAQKTDLAETSIK